MSYRNDGGAAFPMPAGTNGMEHRADRIEHGPTRGMSLRDRIALEVLPEIARGTVHDYHRAHEPLVNAYFEGARDMAAAAYAMADAMIAARDAD